MLDFLSFIFNIVLSILLVWYIRKIDEVEQELVEEKVKAMRNEAGYKHLKARLRKAEEKVESVKDLISEW